MQQTIYATLGIMHICSMHNALTPYYIYYASFNVTVQQTIYAYCSMHLGDRVGWMCCSLLFTAQSDHHASYSPGRWQGPSHVSLTLPHRSGDDSLVTTSLAAWELHGSSKHSTMCWRVFALGRDWCHRKGWVGHNLGVFLRSQIET